MAEKLKDTFFQRPFFESLASQIARVYPAFDRKGFFRLLFDAEWRGRELKARMRHASESLGQILPPDYRRAIAILRKVEKHFEGFDHLVFADFVERFGVGDYDVSIPALEQFTRTTAEFAIRPFIREYPERTMAQMLAWASNESEHVRRLASEGCRPRLPWGTGVKALQKDPSPILPILDALRTDPSESVRRSVANNLNDISKDHPELVLGLAKRWLLEVPETQPLLKHALRGLLKKGDGRAMQLFGYGAAPRVEVEVLRVVPASIRIGGQARLRLSLRSTAKKPQTLRLEYKITYARPQGKSATKVFQIREVELGPRETLELERKLSFADLATRKHSAGKHRLALSINGERLRQTSFQLTRPSRRS